MRLEERRLEHSADDRRARSKKLQERLRSVRNLREEAAVRAEMDLLRMALEGDEQEALTLLDQIRKMEDRLEEEEVALEKARAAVEPTRLQLLQEQKAALEEFALLKEKRQSYAAQVPSPDLQSYERIRGGGRSVAVAPLTPDGACGHCFGMVPLQIQNEVRKGAVSLSCEACGVLLSAGENLT
jgi:predicted  nucleic acid-binding Zn-ribbon protein